MKRLLCLIALAGGSAAAMSGAGHSLKFTEVCVANIDQTIDFSHNYGSWVEVCNDGEADVTLDGWYISDDATSLTKHRLSGYGVLKPGEYRAIFFDHNAADGVFGPDASRQVRFKLSRKGGSLFLSQDGTTADLSLSYPPSIPRCSYARVHLQTDEWQHQGLPTPGEANASLFASEQLPPPEVSCDTRLFTEAFDVRADFPAGTTLRYTTDGSTPTLTNGQTNTDGRFHISATTVLRLRLFAPERLPSGIVTRSYIYKDKDYYLPIVAITTDPRNLYDSQIGCYVDGLNGIQGRGSAGKSNLNMDWERPVNLELLTPEGRMAVNQEASFEVAGGWSRHFKPASFKLQARKLYDGKGDFGHNLFRGKPHNEYKQLLIRNGGNNNRTYGGPRIMDAVTQQVLTTSGFYVDAQEYQPAHVFINGSYLAMMNIREPTGRFHGAANYGYDDDEMDAFEYSSGGYHQKGGTRQAFDEMVQASYLADTDEGFRHLRELLDLDEFVRYMAAVCYTGTGDWLLNDNNVKGYRSTLEGDGKFHFVFFDQDLTWEHTGNVEELDANEIVYLYRNLKENPAFRKQFVTAYCLLHGSIYTPERCQHIADSVCLLVKDALAMDRRSAATTYRILQETMWETRHRQARIKSLMNAYALTDSLNTSLSANCPFARLQIEGMDVPFARFSGVLFGPVNVSADAAEGYRFIGWKDQHGRWLSHEKQLQITRDGSYTAIFDERRDRTLPPICINEVSAANDIHVNDYGKRADWLELFNRSTEPVDVAGWYFSDEKDVPTKYQIDAPDEVNTVLRPGERMVVWCDGRPSLEEPHLPFKLKNADGSRLYLTSPDGKWQDSLRYDMHSAKASVGRYPDGGSDFWTFYRPTIGSQNVPTSYDTSALSIPNGISSPASATDDSSVTHYYSVAGIRLTRPRQGINIIVTDGKAGRTFLLSKPKCLDR